MIASGYRYLGILILLATAVFLGLVLYTFFYAKGYSYLIDDPKACMNCHVMREFYNGWEVSSHRFVTCNGCHVPQDSIHKYWAKADHGIRHSFAFTFENTQIFRLKPSGERVVEDNCIRCHLTMVSQINHGGNGKRCFDCHRGMGHAF